MVSGFSRPFRPRPSATISRWCFVRRHSLYFSSSVQRRSPKPPINRTPTSRRAFTIQLSTSPTSTPAASSPTRSIAPKPGTDGAPSVLTPPSSPTRSLRSTLVLRPLHHRQHLPQRPARRNSPRPLHPRTDPATAQAVRRTHHHPGAHQLRIDGHPAAIVLASVPMPETKGTIPTITYAAKPACSATFPSSREEVRPRRSHPPRPLLRLHHAASRSLPPDVRLLMQFDTGPSPADGSGSVIR